MIRVNVGSKNPVKVEAVREIIKGYGFLNPFELKAFESDSRVSEQPKSQEEMFLGAKNRAMNSFVECDYSFGIESGIFRLGNYENYFDVCFCAIYDGLNIYPGISSGFVVPKKSSDLIFSKGIDLAQAANEIGLTKNSKIGSSEGLVGIVTNGRVDRKNYTKQAITMALVSLENPHYYK